MPRPRPPHRVSGLLTCKCGATITSGHLSRGEFLCDSCFDKQEEQDRISFPEWRGNNARKATYEQ